MSTKWQMYDELIDGIPENLTVTDFAVGSIWTYVRNEISTGVALSVRQRAGRNLLTSSPVGTSLKTIAALSKSWNFVEASIGMAAINSWYNRVDHIKEMGILPEDGDRTKNEIFKTLGDGIRGKNVTVVGHFPYIEKQLGPVCNLSILEREPSEGDLPDPACEYIMAEQDYVIITGMTFTNKTLPRLLELTRPGAVISLAGPSVPMAEFLKSYGVTDLSGFCVTDEDGIIDTIKQGLRQKIFAHGYMLDYKLAPSDK